RRESTTVGQLIANSRSQGHQVRSLIPFHQVRSAYPAAANDFVAVIEDGRLAGSDGALRLVERGDDFAGDRRLKRSPGGLMAVTDLDFYAHGGGQLGNADPIELSRAQSRRGKFGVSANGDTVAGGINREHIERGGR